MVAQSESYRPIMVGLPYFFQLNTAWGEIMAYLTTLTLNRIALLFWKAFIRALLPPGSKGTQLLLKTSCFLENNYLRDFWICHQGQTLLYRSSSTGNASKDRV